MSRRLVSPLVGLAAALAAGCGGGAAVAPPDYGSEDGLKIAQLVSRFDDARGDPQKFKALFADAPPANRKEYDKYMYSVVPGSPKADGATAAAAVGVHKESTYELVGTKEWTFAKVGAGWKIKAAPLP